MQNQLVCGGCRSMILYPSGVSNVCCAICNLVTFLPPYVMETTQLICVGCQTMLMHVHGATGVGCPRCHTMNLVSAGVPSNNVAHINCGNCQAMLMYPAGALSVKCAICQFITNVNTTCHSHNQTVIVRNPMTVDENGKLVSNVAVGVTTWNVSGTRHP